MMSIAALIEAADYLERREREAEHGYAITPVVSSQNPQTNLSRKIKNRCKARKIGGNRSTHNELEKNRRAHLRTCLERLRDEVPAGSDSSRNTTMGLLTRATDYIRSLEEKDRMNDRYKEQLAHEQRLLMERVSGLVSRTWRATKHRASNSSSSSSCSSVSSGYATSEAVDSDDLESGTRSPAAELEVTTCDLDSLAMTAAHA